VRARYETDPARKEALYRAAAIGRMVDDIDASDFDYPWEPKLLPASCTFPDAGV
jgi:hypothetical protein